MTIKGGNDGKDGNDVPITDFTEEPAHYKGRTNYHNYQHYHLRLI